jgi:bifunctional non-homologous end joining protein LigD
MPDEQVSVSVGDRVLRLTNLSKILYPEADFSKGEIVDYYVGVAAALLPRLAGRPVTFRRYPNGADTAGFFEKDVSRHAPDWVRTAALPTPGSSTNRDIAHFVLIEDLPTLVWAANLAALELHVPQWRVGDDGVAEAPDLLVFDLDPGAPATIVECCRVALLVRGELAADGLEAWPKTSGSKGLQLYVPVSTTDPDETSAYARALAGRLAKAHRGSIVATMEKRARPGKVFIDWSQNNPAKTTVAAYSLRARPQPTVSAPVTWDEVEACESVPDLTFTANDVRDRLDADGDLLADLDDANHPELPPVE